MRDEELFRVGAKDMDTSGYQMSDLEQIEFHWEDPDLNTDAVLRPGVDIPFSPSNFKDFETSSMAENITVTDEEKDKERFPPLRTIAVSERPSLPLVLMRNCPVGT